ncbi:phage tail sheath family protein [Rhodococcus aetherivorans]|uniref:phage tail sheath family protein n=1 Tax=Rhodococcus aetherivorans TaxID=191292 RepID=UPI00366E7421
MTTSYPGVYIEEISSGVRTIVGVATSITAFLGQAAAGPTDEAVTIFSFSDFVRRFGDLDVRYPMGYAVRDFFLNGGAQAVIVRLYKSPLQHVIAAARAAAAAAADGTGTAQDAKEAREKKEAAEAAEAEGTGMPVPDDAKEKAQAAQTDLEAAKTKLTDAQAKLTEAQKAEAANKGTVDEVKAAAAAVEAAKKETVTKAQKAAAAAQAALPFAPSGIAQLAVGKNADALILRAASPGSWGDALLARVDSHVSAEVAAAYRLTTADLFNLKLRLGPQGPLETFLNVTVKESPRRVDRVLLAESSLGRVLNPNNLGQDVPSSNDDPPVGVSPWEGQTPSRVTQKGSSSADLDQSDYAGDRNTRTGKYLLEDVDLINMVCVLGNARNATVDATVYSDMLEYCVERRAFLVVDPPLEWTHDSLVSTPAAHVTALNLTGPSARNAAVFYPRIRAADPQRGGQIDTFPACGAITGIMARTDAQRGVWKAAAGIDAAMVGTVGLADQLTDGENGVLNQVGINVLRTFPVFGRVVWGARTLRGADQATDEYKYIPVRRTALFLEESLYRGLKWVVFEPNDEPLWAQIRLNVGSFLNSLFRQGAFQGATPAQAYFVKCDKDTTTQDDINKGIVRIVVGFAPLKPAEFVIVQLQQMAGQTDS